MNFVNNIYSHFLDSIFRFVPSNVNDVEMGIIIVFECFDVHILENRTLHTQFSHHSDIMSTIFEINLRILYSVISVPCSCVNRLSATESKQVEIIRIIFLIDLAASGRRPIHGITLTSALSSLCFLLLLETW